PAVASRLCLSTYPPDAPRALHSSPTRRSSDLVRGLTGDRRSGLDEGASTLVRFHEPDRPELSHCLTDSARRDPIALHQHGLTRRSEEHTSELQSRFDLVCRLLLAT